MPNIMSDEQIELVAKHAAEMARLQAKHQNERMQTLERQRKELEDAGLMVPSNNGPTSPPHR